MIGPIREILVCYDIQDNRVRTRMFKTLEGMGLISIQKSVFWGFVSPAEEKAVQRELKLHLEDEGDRGIVVHSNLNSNDDRAIGYQGQIFERPKNYAIV